MGMGAEEQVHRDAVPVRLEGEPRQDDNRLAALAEEDRRPVEVPELLELDGGIAHDDPPPGTWLMNVVPSRTCSFCPGPSVKSSPSLMTLSR